uniref:Uncharacterized protein n=1 Tax=Chrysodeixis chalcites nucleopolyhedrovirus TaxID=320432 RepID=T1R011_9ABAC|nr:hypothetical protein [Chrysodeixis chalcites nucleopolyhedrovirus]
MEQITEIAKFQRANRDNVGGHWIHRVVVSMLCCNKIYKVEAFNAKNLKVFVPSCSCEIEKVYVEDIITDCNGNAFLRINRYNYHDVEKESTEPKRYGIYITSYYLLYMNLEKEFTTVELYEPTAVQPNLAREFDQKEKKWHRNRNHDERFDKCYGKLLDAPPEDFPLLDRAMENVDHERKKQQYLSEKNLTELESFEEFKLLFKDTTKTDMQIWKYLDENYLIFDTIKEDDEESMELYNYIEELNLGDKITYYGHKVLRFLTGIHENPIVDEYERLIYQAVASKYPDNNEVEQWLVYNGDVDSFTTPGLKETIEQIKFDVSYDFFVEKFMTNLPKWINRNEVTFYCDKGSVDECAHKWYQNNNEGVTIDPCNNFWPAMLLTDAIKSYASKHNNSFTFVDRTKNQTRKHVIGNINKYPELWKFIDLLNIYTLNKRVLFTGLYDDINYKINWIHIFDNKNFTYEYVLTKTFLNRYHSTFDTVLDTLCANKQQIEDEENEDHDPLIVKLFFENIFPDDFIQEYCNMHKFAAHVHTIPREKLFTNNATTFEIKSIDGSIVLWPGNTQVLRCERKRHINKISNWWLEHMYKPESRAVKRIKLHFDSLCQQTQLKSINF